MDDSRAFMLVEQHRDELIRIVGEANVCFHHDNIAERPYKLTPSVTVTPEHEDQVAELLHWASARSIQVIPQGGGTKDAFGLCASSGSMILSMTKLTGILHHSVGDLTVTVLPGTTLRDLQEELGRKGQFLPLDPSWSEQATLGGIVAANNSGPKRALYGSVRDFLIASRVACTDGKIIRTGAKVVKNVAGYDMNKLFIGAMGTLGVFTELTFRIRPLPTSSGLLVLSTPSPEKLRDFQTGLLDSHLEPCALEVVSASTVSDILNITQSAIFILFEDVEQSVQYQIEWVRYYAKRFGMEEIYACHYREIAELMVQRLRGIVPNANDVADDRITVGLKLISAISNVPDIFQFTEESGQKEEFDIRFTGGLYTGISYVCLSTDVASDEEIMNWIKGVRDYVEQLKGHAIVEFASKRIRSAVSVWGNRNEGTEIMSGIKQKFDPAHILNNGRFVGGI
jgi:glycolate oxidase FAD binding subunit